MEAYEKPTRVRPTRRGNGQSLREIDMNSIPSKTPSIYQIRHIASGKVYVGSAVDPRGRRHTHVSALRRGVHHSQYLQHAWNKYGEDAFVFEVIEPVLFVEDLITREQYWIDALRAGDRKCGYNVSPTAGSALGTKHTDETCVVRSERAKVLGADPVVRARRSEQAKALWTDPAYRERRSAQSKAQSNTPEAKAIFSERSKAYHASPAARAKQSARSKALWADPEWRARQVAARSTPEYRARASKQYADREASPPMVRGSKHTDASRVKMSAGQKERTSNPAYRAKRSELAKAQYADPAARAKVSERSKAQFADPAQRAMLSERAKKQFADPEARAKLIERNRARAADPAHREKIRAGLQARRARLAGASTPAKDENITHEPPPSGWREREGLL